MKKKNIIIYSILFLISISLLAVGCHKKNTNKETAETEEISIYFVNQSDGKLIAENLSYNPKEYEKDEDKVSLAVDALKKGPQGATLLPVIFDSEIILGSHLNGNSVIINLSNEYNNLNVQNQMTLRASFVRTLTNLPFVNSVEFFLEDEPLMSLEGETIGPIYKDDIVLVQPDPKPNTNVQNITLYFGDEQGLGLVSENRKININNNVPLERYVVEELIKGPRNENYFRTVPAETKINDVGTKDGVCQVDLSAEFKSKHPGGSTGELYTIYSIVNSLTESSPKVKKVAFLIDGKKQAEFKGHLDLSILFERDESLIVEKEKE